MKVQRSFGLLMGLVAVAASPLQAGQQAEPAGAQNAPASAQATGAAEPVGSDPAVRAAAEAKLDRNLGTIGDHPFALSAQMRSGTTDPAGPAPRTAWGTPDLNGVWVDSDMTPKEKLPKPVMKPWARDIQAQLDRLNRPKGNEPGPQGPAAYCLPQHATPTALFFPYQFVQTKDVLVQITEYLTPGHRIIYLDGRPHPDPNESVPGWFGHSVGHWEGDTLVIDTTGFNEITPGYAIHSEKLHVVERIRILNSNEIEVSITAEDPEAWEKPFQATFHAGRANKSQEIMEWVCADNNKDVLHFGGQQWRGRP